MRENLIKSTFLSEVKQHKNLIFALGLIKNYCVVLKIIILVLKLIIIIIKSYSVKTLFVKNIVFIWLSRIRINIMDLRYIFQFSKIYDLHFIG